MDVQSAISYQESAAWFAKQARDFMDEANAARNSPYAYAYALGVVSSYQKFAAQSARWAREAMGIE